MAYDETQLETDEDDVELDEYLVRDEDRPNLENDPESRQDEDDNNDDKEIVEQEHISPDEDDEDDEEDDDIDGTAADKADLDTAFLEANMKSGHGGDLSEGSIIRERINSTQDAMRTLLSTMSPEQRKRYETFRRVSLPRPAIRRLLYKILAAPALQSAAKDSNAASTGHLGLSAMIGIGGMAKVFVGELVETAIEVRNEWIQAGIEDVKTSLAPLLPSHILEAHRRMRLAHAVPSSTIYRKRSRFL